MKMTQLQTYICDAYRTNWVFVKSRPARVCRAAGSSLQRPPLAVALRMSRNAQESSGEFFMKLYTETSRGTCCKLSPPSIMILEPMSEGAASDAKKRTVRATSSCCVGSLHGVFILLRAAFSGSSWFQRGVQT